MLFRSYDDGGDLETEEEVYELFQRVVETDGEFLWAKRTRSEERRVGKECRCRW